jgi:hypothetical protein
MNDLIQKLCETADALARNSPPPVEIRGLCFRFGVQIRRDSSQRVEGKRAFLVESSQAVEIVLPPTDLEGNELSTWDRFLVAHELGHFLLSQLKVPKPLGAREYWRIEGLCDMFARRLLLPASEVSTAVFASGNSAVGLLGATLNLRKRWAVPWAVAAHEVTGSVGLVHFFNFIAVADRFRVKTSTSPNRRGINRMIPASSSLGSLLRDLPRHDQKPKRISVAEIEDFEPLKCAVEAAAYRAGINEYRIAALVS